ncbi:TrmH family RNA methyltransferase [Cohaesibacter celericrescens]|uniref:23S rRNA (Guanosine(2251)-2'-O)-methyltransferase RlmB n=1 Tax=Cohaesibacter celericrescens TaxID=2067669 RepID=A0A2N5XXK1_9HYPH|nr:RNA methyltransferase [Cohaesibacter celericrescens]PLW79231.1 23S rRNA (guanosine(2251)-2'-O)-methyltransferase RlmB [Cohaesibacter celericrescens]
MSKNKSQRVKKARQANAAETSTRVGRKAPDDTVRLFGIHAVASAIANPRRELIRLHATTNAQARLIEEITKIGGDTARLDGIVETATPKDIDALARDAVHQGALLVVKNLPALDISDAFDAKLVIVLDQITDPHNVGAIIRSGVALGAEGIVMTGRHSPEESGVLAKTASGGLDQIAMVTVPNLARALDDLADHGFDVVGFDSEESEPFETIIAAQDNNRPLALVFGSEGKGLRRLTREKCTALARLDMPGPIKSLNVSNAVAMTLYAVELKRQGKLV